VGILLAGGDAEIAAIGTVTEVVGDRVLALGHPLLFAGDVDLPLTTAYVHGTVPLASRSFKMASPGQTVGLVTGDRRAGIAGRLGLPADLLPMEVRIEMTPRSEPRTYHYQVIRDRALSPLLSSVLAMNSLLAERALVEDGLVSVGLEADLVGGRRLVWTDRVMSPLPPLTLAERVQRPLSLLLANPFAAPQLEGLRVTARVDSGGQWGWIEQARLARPAVAPGDTVEAVVTLRPYRGPSLSRTLSIPVPVTLPEDTLVLRLCDADSAAAWDAGRAPDRLVPRSLEDVLRLLESERRHDAIYAQLVRRESGRVVGGRELPGLPTSVLSAMTPQGDPARVKPTQAGILVEQHLTIPFQVVGSVELPVVVTPRARRH
jgi:hypothetical protein